MNEPRLCACGCGQRLDGRRGNTRYVDPRHRQRAYRNRLQREAEAKGLSSTLTMRSVRASTPTRKRHRDARRAPRAPDMRVSYRKAVAIIEERLHHYGFAPGSEHVIAKIWMDRALTERQRAALEERGRGA